MYFRKSIYGTVIFVWSYNVVWIYCQIHFEIFFKGSQSSRYRNVFCHLARLLKNSIIPGFRTCQWVTRIEFMQKKSPTHSRMWKKWVHVQFFRWLKNPSSFSYTLACKVPGLNPFDTQRQIISQRLDISRSYKISGGL